MARPSLDTPSRLYRVTLCLRPGEDDDLIAFLERLPPRGRATAVIGAMRAGGVTAVCDDLDADEAGLLAALDEMMF